MALGTIKDIEYDFIRNAVVKHRLRLTRNKENRTALNTIKAFSGQSAGLRGQPNFKRKIWEFFELRMTQDPTFMDVEEDTEVMNLIRADNLEGLKTLIEEKQEGAENKAKELIQLLEQRNFDGKTAFYLAVELERLEIVEYLLIACSHINVNAKDCREGNTPLHMAVKAKNAELTKLLFDLNPKKCLEVNFYG